MSLVNILLISWLMMMVIIWLMMVNDLVGGDLTILKKYESQWEGLSHILWKIKHVPNHQPEYLEILKPEPQ